MDIISLALLGAFFIVFGRSAITRRSTIKKNGITVEGVIAGFVPKTGSLIKPYRPIIKFLTSENEWIAEPLSFGGYYGFYKAEQKVKVIYDKTNPRNFIISDVYTFFLSYGLYIIGVVLFSYGAYSIIILLITIFNAISWKDPFTF